MWNYDAGIYTIIRWKKTMDIQIGRCIKSRRVTLEISQAKLGEYLGVTFQQVQKYEKGINRISASALFRLAEFLKVDISYFAKGDECCSHNKIAVHHSDATDSDLPKLVSIYNKIETKETKILLLKLSYVLLKQSATKKSR
jgi:transcriptional regulator with XRE-family HTH domain